MTPMTASYESEVEYWIASLSPQEITVFRQMDDEGVHVYQLELVQKDEIKQDTKEKVVLELREVYDLKLKKIINVWDSEHDVEGTLELEDGKVTNIYAHVNGFDIEPQTVTDMGNASYRYGAENPNDVKLAMGKIQGAFINANEFNAYFISGPYKGHTLIFARTTPLEIESEGAVLASESQDSGDFLTGEAAITAQKQAIAERQQISHQAERKPAALALEGISEEEHREISSLVAARDNGEELNESEEHAIERYAEKVIASNGLDFSSKNREI